MSPDKPTVTIESGQLLGTYVQEKKGRAAIFKGIPYAQPPIGRLRWRPPHAVVGWTGVRPATEYGPMAMQRSAELMLFLDGIMDVQGMGWARKQLIKQAVKIGPKPPESEDCLTLNVRTPDVNGRLPVMVWIHGGAHQSGSSQDVFYESNALVHQGVVVVSINYRLGLMGYLAHPELSAESDHNVSGNYGTLDQIAALKWVQTNISAFGGDPDNVTIFGESAGGESVLHLMVSPLAHGLFHKAIAQSSATGAQLVRLKEPFHVHQDAETTGAQFATLAGADSIKVLRAMPAERLQAIVNGQQGAMGAFHPVIDGHVLPKSIFELFQGGEQARVPFLIGSNADEATLFYPLFQDPLPEYHGRSQLNGRLPAYMTSEFGDDLDALLSLYPGLDTLEKEAVTRLQGDVIFGAPARFYAGQAAGTGQPTFLYHFKRIPPSPNQTGGAFHAAELPFVHGSQTPIMLESQADKSLGQVMRHYWTNFAKWGDPNGEREARRGDTAVWEPFQEQNPRWMELDVDHQQMAPVSREAKYQLLIGRLRKMFAAVPQ